MRELGRALLFGCDRVIRKLSPRHRDKDEDGTASVLNAQQSPVHTPVPGIDSSSEPTLPGSSDCTPQPAICGTVSLSIDSDFQDGPICKLWDTAYEKLRQEENDLVEKYEKHLKNSLGSSSQPNPTGNGRLWVDAVLRQKIAEVKKNMWKLTFGRSDVPVGQLLQPVMRVAKLLNNFITASILPGPYASMAWVGTSALLSFLLQSTDQLESLAKGLDYISMLISQTTMREDLYDRYYQKEYREIKELSMTHLIYKSTLEELYKRILKFQVKSYCYCVDDKTRSHFIKRNDWESLIEGIREQERKMTTVHEVWRDGKYDQERTRIEKLQQEAVVGLEDIGAGLESLLEAIEDNKKQQDHRVLLRWLCNIDPSLMFNIARNRHKTGTSEWLIKRNATFRKWIENSSSFLWLHGKAGSGKSVLSSSVIQFLNDKHKHDPTIAIVYFYFSFSDAEKQERDGMLASLIKQICCCRPNTPESLKRLGQYESKGMRPSTKELEKELIIATRGFSAVYLVIDGLDECPELGGRRDELMVTLHYILEDKSDNIHLFCTSRKETDIDSSLSPYLDGLARIGLDLSAYHLELESDIRHFIDSTLAERRYNSWPDDIKSEVKEALIKKSDGMFQYVRCQFDELMRLKTPGEVRQTLEDLPRGLDNTYRRMLQNIDSRYQTRAINALKWLCFSLRTLTLEELAEIFSLQPKDGVIVVGKEERLFHSKDVLSFFSGLVIVQEQQNFVFNRERWSEDAKVPVRLAHFSIKEYLTSHRFRQDNALFAFSDLDAHLWIVYWSLAYHIYLTTLDRKGYEASCLLRTYAALDWPVHLETVPRASWPADIIEMVIHTLTMRSRSISNIALEYIRRGTELVDNSYISTLYKPNEARAKMELFDMRNLVLRPYCYTAWRGFFQLTELLLSQRLTANEYLIEEDLDSALWNAVCKGNKKIVPLLLDKGANVNALPATSDETRLGGEMRGDALQVAIFNGDTTMVKLLTAKGADINARRGDWGSPLEAAARHGHLDILKLLVRIGANIKGFSTDAGQALSVTSKASPCLQFLVDSGANITLPHTDPPKETVLNEFIRKGDWREFDLMLEGNPDLNLGGNGSSPLHELIVFSPTSIEDALPRIGRLLDLGADPNSQDKDARTALYLACERHDASIANLLIDYGADVNMAGGCGRTALQLCAYEGFTSLVHLLLKHGADPTAQGGEFGNALQGAVAGQKADMIEIMQLLMDHGADVNAQGNYNETALQAACALGNSQVVRWLLEHGADVDGKDGKYGTAFHAACAEHHIDIIRLLLDHNTDVNIRDKIGGTALQFACTGDNLAHVTDVEAKENETEVGIIQQQLSRTSDAKTRYELYKATLKAATVSNLTGSTPISAPRLSIPPGIMRRYNRTRTQVPCNDYGRPKVSPKKSRYGKSKEIALFLLESGAEVNARGGKYGTALQAACAYGKLDVVQVLLDRGADVNIHGGHFGTALQAACVHGKPELVRLLIDRGADVNAQAGRFGSPLQASVVLDKEIEMIRILIEHGANFQVQAGGAGGYNSLLHYLAIKPYANTDATLKLLLENNLNINKVDDKFGTALQILLSPEGYRELQWHEDRSTATPQDRWMSRIRLFLENGANPSVRGGRYGFALQALCAIESELNTQYVKVNVKDPGDRRPGGSNYEICRNEVERQKSDFNRLVEAADILLGKCPDIDINARGGLFGTALQAASFSGNTKMVRWLLNRKGHIVCNEHCGKYRTALNAAIIRNYWDIVDILLKAEAKPDCYLILQPDEEWLAQIREEHGPGAEARYRKFWEVKKSEYDRALLARGRHIASYYFARAWVLIRFQLFLSFLAAVFRSLVKVKKQDMKS